MEQVAGVILAGGLSRRMGGCDKAFSILGGKPMIAHVFERLRGQASPIAINANGDPARFGAFAVPVIADLTTNFSGPLAGILAGMRWALEAAPAARFIATAACDTPFIPHDLVSRLFAEADGDSAVIVLPASGGRTHPMCGLWPVTLAGNLESVLDGEGRKVQDWIHSHRNLTVEYAFSTNPGSPADPFFNVNSPLDLVAADAAFATGRGRYYD